MDWHGQRIALLLWATNADGSDDVVRRAGELRVVDGAVSFWQRGEWKLDLRAEWLDRIRPSPPDSADILGDAPWVLSLSVGDCEDGGPGLDKTGLKWPTAE